MWEFSFCYYCDHEDRVKKWACEPEQHKIQYDVIENEQYTIKTYIPDFWMIVEKSNNDETHLFLKMFLTIKNSQSKSTRRERQHKRRISRVTSTQ
jgi:hypothetical protein